MTPIPSPPATHSMRWSVIAMATVVVVYLGVLFGIDSGRQLFTRLSEMAAALPVIVASSVASYLVRFARWQWLLAGSGYRLPVWKSLLSYAAGFAFTASPGKAGELIRTRYLARQGVPSDRVVACFIFERLLDLVVILAFACLLAGSIPGLGVAFAFVAAVLIAIVAAARLERLRLVGQLLLRRARLRLPARILRVVLLGIRKSSDYTTSRTLIGAALLGIAAWAIQCIGYALGLLQLGIAVPFIAAFAVAPAAMLIGAASMLPGGIGTTEAATVVILTYLGVDLGLATLAAITLRLASIWFAMLIGFAAVIILERSLAS